MNAKTKNLTTGSPLKLIMGFALPMLVGFLFQQLYNLVDTAIVGRCLGVDALAAVGTTGAINFMITGFCIGTTSGFSIPVAQQFGAGNEKEMRKYVYNAAVLTVVFATTVTLLICLSVHKILQIMQTPANIAQDAWIYIFIIFLGLPVAFFYNICAGFIRSLGDSKTPVYFLILASVLNAGLDLFTILVLHMGVAGPAAATVFSQAVAAVLCYRYMRKHYPILVMEPDEKKMEKRKALRLCAMGIPMGLQYSITAIGNIINQSAVNALGSLSVASYSAGNKISMFMACPYDALGGTMATYVGQNIGAGKPERVKQGVLAASGVGILYGFVVFGLMLIGGEWVSALFLGAGETEAIRQTAQLLHILTMSYFLLTLVNVVRFSIQGMGYSTLAILAGVCEMIGRGTVGAFLVPVYGFMAACYAAPLAWVLADLFLVPAFFLCLRRRTRELNQQL